jgi:hypothetical protein
MAGGMAQVVEHLLFKCKALSTNPTTTKKEKNYFAGLPCLILGHKPSSFQKVPAITLEERMLHKEAKKNLSVQAFLDFYTEYTSNHTYVMKSP